MTIETGTRLGPYEVVAPIGAGGMGEVYKAKDTRLDRMVAIKVLPEHLAESPERKARFEREAKAISQLNHPHICTLHDVGDQDGVDFIVMEYIEGETLAERLKKGPLKLDQALEYGIRIADALDKAHRAGIIHRDLKPGNIMLTQSGIKLLDFGLAKLVVESAADEFSDAPTEQRDLTKERAIIGTPRYMAPEQLEGKAADTRTDIFALGAVVYEMVTGKRALEADALHSMSPPFLDHVVRRCLAKDADERWQSASDVMRELKWVREAPREREPAPVHEKSWVALAIMTLIAAGLGLTMWLRPAPELRELRLDILTPPSPNPAEFAISPDGSQIVFVGYDDSVAKLMLRRLDEDLTSVRPLEGTDNSRGPFWSPDSSSIAFWGDGRLKTIEVATGSIRSLGSSSGAGGTWSQDNIIVYGNSRLFRVAATGTSDPVPLDLERAAYPAFLPSGRHFLFYNLVTRTVNVAELESSRTTELVRADGEAIFSPPSTLLYVQEGTLYAHDFDPERIELGDEPPVPIVSGILQTFSDVAVSAAANGILAYRTRAATPTPRFTWVDRSGGVEVAAEPAGVFAGALELSSDGRYVAFEQESVVNGDLSIYSLDLARGGALARVTAGSVADAQPTWSPDAAHIAFLKVESAWDLHVTSVNAPGARQKKLFASPVEELPLDWSPDGRWLLYMYFGAEGANIMALPMDGDTVSGEPIDVIASPGNDAWAQFSPDGRWIAFESDRSGELQIYVKRFQEPGAETPVTREGGTQVRWSPRGDEMFYIDLEGEFMAVSIRLPRDGGEPEVGEPQRLFTAPIGSLNFRGHQYDVSPDGERFLMNMPREANSAITVLLRSAR